VAGPLGTDAFLRRAARRFRELLLRRCFGEGDGALGVELRRRRLRELLRDRLRRRCLAEVVLRDRLFACFTLRDFGDAETSRLCFAFRSDKYASFSFWYALNLLDFLYAASSLSYFAFSFSAFLLYFPSSESPKSRHMLPISRSTSVIFMSGFELTTFFRTSFTKIM